MDEIIKEELRAGEKVLWTGSPESFETLDVTNKQPVIKKGIMIIGVIVALCIIYIAYALSKGIEIKPALVVIAMACAIAGSVNFISDARKLRRMKYAITDQRIIFKLDLAKSLEFAKISEVEFKTDADGHTSILFGKNAIKAKAHQWRSLALADAYIDEDTGLCSRFAMYAIPEAEEVKKILGEHIAI